MTKHLFDLITKLAPEAYMHDPHTIENCPTTHGNTGEANYWTATSSSLMTKQAVLSSYLQLFYGHTYCVPSQTQKISQLPSMMQICYHHTTNICKETQVVC